MGYKKWCHKQIRGTGDGRAEGRGQAARKKNSLKKMAANMAAYISCSCPNLQSLQIRYRANISPSISD